ncbi:MAG TPA: glycosyltransferase [Vicinamibacterales bacterium]|nr:glycosyltransferase [Vicinamibacterales bacterium]
MLHILTPEFPPRIGGVADYARALAGGLAAAGEIVHVWCPAADRPEAPADGVVVHPVFDGFGPEALRRAGRALDACPPPRRLLVQWVPHGYGWRGMNGAFALWLWLRARRGDRLELVVHEPFFEIEGPLRHRVMAVAQRAMAAVVLRAASRVWVTVPAWETRLRPYSPRRRVPLGWVPVPSTIPVAHDAARVDALRERAGAGRSGLLAGHFGSGGDETAATLSEALAQIVRVRSEARLVFIGRRSGELAQQTAALRPGVADRVLATGPLDAREVSCWLAACDLMLQPYPDGVSARRTSTISALAHGRPIVTTAGRLTEPLWSESHAVRLVPAGEIGAFAQAAAEVAASADERLRLRIAARALYHARFDLERIVAAIRE